MGFMVLDGGSSDTDFIVVNSALSLLELLVLLLSTVAAVNHFRAAGKRFSETARFHVFHLSYCSLYVAYKIGQASPPYGFNSLGVSWKTCRAVRVNSVLSYTPILIAWLACLFTFFDHFDRVLCGRVRSLSQRTREIVYAALVALLLVNAIILGTSPETGSYVQCRNDAMVIFKVHLVAVSFVTFVDMANLCSNFWKKCVDKSRWDEVRIIAVVVFVTMSVFSAMITILVGVAERRYRRGGFERVQAGVFAFQILFFVPMSYFTLGFTWDRNYLSSVESQPTEDIIDHIEWHSNEMISIEAGSDSLVVDEQDPVVFASTGRLVRGSFATALKLCALHEFSETAGQTGQSASRVVVIEETLAISPFVLPVASMYANTVAAPLLEKSLTTFLRRVDALLERFSPAHSSRTGLGNLELLHQFEVFKKRCDDLREKFGSRVVALGQVVRELGAIERETTATASNELFKASKQKKKAELALISTNCQVHSVSLRRPSPPPPTTQHLNSVTFGAPAAHALGFKEGSGLRSMKLKAARAEASSCEGTGATFESHLASLKLEHELRFRECVVLSQALAPAVTATAELLRSCLENRLESPLRQAFRIGILLHSVCLLSTSGKETGMLEDFSAAYELLDLKLRLEPAHLEYEKDGEEAGPRKVGDASAEVRLVAVGLEAGNGAGQVVVRLSVAPTEVFEWMVGAVGMGMHDAASFRPVMRVVPVLFNLGVNEQQTVANATGSTSLQTEINERAVDLLRAYHRDFFEFVATGVGGSHKDLGDLPELFDLLASLVEEEKKDRNKLVDLLLVSCFIARAMHGARTTSCKSAKDRTSVFQTLEVARFAERSSFLHRDMEPRVLEVLRGVDGVRLRNCEANTGKAKYAFNTLQCKALPAELRPPPSTITNWGQS